MKKLSLFSGIGGDDLASEWAGIETICFVEKDKYCQKVLKKHWPDIPIIEDVQDVTKEKVKEVTGQEWIDIISGGFPCQPHSVAGERKGSLDERNLWPEFRRIVGEIKPRWVVAENVPGIFSSDSGRFFGGILSDLAEMGYSVGWCTFGAVDVGALHRRNRVFIVAHSKQSTGTSEINRWGECQPEWNKMGDINRTGSQDVADTINKRLQGRGCRELQERASELVTGESSTLPDSERTRWPAAGAGTYFNSRLESEKGNRRGWQYWQFEPQLCRIFDGISQRLDRCGLTDTPYAIMVLDAIKEVSNATDTEARRDKNLSTMPETTNTEEIQRNIRGQWGISPPEILQSDLHGEVSDKGDSQQTGSTQKGSEVPKGSMREVWGKTTIKHPSHKHGRIGQLTGKLDDTLRSMPHEMALGTRQEKNQATEYVLQNLWRACSEIGYVPETLSEIPKIWESLNDEEKDWVIIRCGTGNYWHTEWPGIPRVATRIKARVDRLKGLGNAVVPAQIYPIYKAIMELENGK
ncbi:MAG: DNA (cytosine-5-)-methyltransferase [Dehalococcoidales bacterium]|nr:DNA (cytosine-5-)-methyltransferase [Dehalococcoidales bacterium]